MTLSHDDVTEVFRRPLTQSDSSRTDGSETIDEPGNRQKNQKRVRVSPPWKQSSALQNGLVHAGSNFHQFERHHFRHRSPGFVLCFADSQSYCGKTGCLYEDNADLTCLWNWDSTSIWPEETEVFVHMGIKTKTTNREKNTLAIMASQLNVLSS